MVLNKYFPEPKFPFTRLYEPKNRSKKMAPDEQTAIVLELPCYNDEAIWKIPDFIELLKKSGFSPTKHQMYFYKTMFLPLFLIGLILIAGSFTIKFSKTKTRNFFLILTCSKLFA